MQKEQVRCSPYILIAKMRHPLVCVCVCECVSAVVTWHVFLFVVIFQYKTPQKIQIPPHFFLNACYCPYCEWFIHACLFIYIYIFFFFFSPIFFYFVIIKTKCHNSVFWWRCQTFLWYAYFGLLQSFSPHKPHPFSQSSASKHSDLPSSSQHPMNRTSIQWHILLHFCFFINPFHFNVHQNMEDMICLYFCFFAIFM